MTQINMLDFKKKKIACWKKNVHQTLYDFLKAILSHPFEPLVKGT